MGKKMISLLLCLLLTGGTVFAAFTPQIDVTDGEKMYGFFNTILSITEKQYRFGVTREELLDAAIKEVLKEHPELFDEMAKGAYGILDENSRYLTIEEYEGRSEQVSGQFEGIGINVSEYDGVTLVGSPIKGSPAQLAGIQAGDVIVSVDGEDIRGYVLDQTVALIRGERGTPVEIGVTRGGEQLMFTVTRDVIKINPVTHYALGENNAGYVAISTFNANTGVYLDDALRDLARQGVDKVILDLRYNLGGLLSEAVRAASYFVPDDVIVVSEDFQNPEKNTEYRAARTDIKFKTVVLVNEYSASASEIVAAAIQDHGAGVLAGKTTFGKGTVQQSVHLKNGGAMWLTIAKYLTPSGAYIHEVGITPDYWVRNTTEKPDTSVLEPITGERTLTFGAVGKDVLAVEQRLELMGYPMDTVDEVYNEQTELMVSNFQRDAGLFVYGTADLTTQIKIMEAAGETEVEVDKQLEKAKELILALK
ncbi:MAG: S41 family peptidase [Clostridiales bacterium]|nr:S41 family peptidase [Clostridiales bacterium]